MLFNIYIIGRVKVNFAAALAYSIHKDTIIDALSAKTGRLIEFTDDEISLIESALWAKSPDYMDLIEHINQTGSLFIDPIWIDDIIQYYYQIQISNIAHDLVFDSKSCNIYTYKKISEDRVNKIILKLKTNNIEIIIDIEN